MYKKELQELCQKRQWGLPKYEASKVGPDHVPRFAAAVVVNGVAFRTSDDESDCFRSSKEAQNHAAHLALLHYSSSPPPPPPSSSRSTSQPEALLQNSYQKALSGNSYESETSMSKNQLQNFAQKKNMNLPEYGFVREGPPHAPRFKATVKVGNQTFTSPAFFQTLKEAEHAAARVALETLSPQGPEGFCPFKGLLQEFCLKEGINMPIYETKSSGPSHSPVFTSTVSVDGKKFDGEPINTKKQSENLAAKVAWSNLKERQLCSQPVSSQILKTQEALENTSVGSSVVNDLSATDSLISNTAQIFEPDSGSEGGYKNKLQCFAQRKNMSLPVYESIRDGPSHAAAFKASVTINAQTFESTEFSHTIKEAEQAAAKIALETLAQGALDKELAPPFKSLLQEFCLKQGFCSPIYETSSTGPSHLPIFTSIVKVDGKNFDGKPAKSKKQAEVLAAKLAWSTFKKSKQQIGDTFHSQVSEIQKALECSTLCNTSVVMNDINENNEVINKGEMLQLVTDVTGVKETGESIKDELADVNVFHGRSSLPISGIESAENLTGADRQDQPVDDAYASLQDSPDVYKDLGLCHRPVMKDKSNLIPEEVENNFSVTNKILVLPRASNVKSPSGAVALPIQDDIWIAFTMNAQHEKHNAPK